MRSEKSKVAEPAVTRKRTAPARNWGLGWLIDKFNPECNTTTAMLDLVSTFAEDRALAEDLQFQEVLRFSSQSERACALCKQMFPSQEASWKPDNCDHAICIACFCQYAPEIEATGVARCAVASCESLRILETHQGVDVYHDALSSFEDMDGRKGKEPLDGMLQEFGECSRGADVLTGSNFYCAICMESVHVRELFPIAGCTHTFCVGCVGQYIAAKVEENVVSIGCPDPGCKDGTLHPEECRDVIPFQVFQRWGAALCDSALGALKFYCPFKDCSAMLVDDHGQGEAAITQAKSKANPRPRTADPPHLASMHAPKPLNAAPTQVSRWVRTFPGFLLLHTNSGAYNHLGARAETSAGCCAEHPVPPLFSFFQLDLFPTCPALRRRDEPALSVHTAPGCSVRSARWHGMKAFPVQNFSGLGTMNGARMTYC